MNPEITHGPVPNTAVYSALQLREAEHRPIRVGVVGAGATGRAIALQLGTPVPGIRLAGIANRTIEHGERALREAGMANWKRVSNAKEAETTISRGLPVLVDDPSVLTTCDAIDLIVEVTGSVGPAAPIGSQSFDSGKPPAFGNGELESFYGT